MKLGLNIGYSGAKLDLPVKRILRAEESQGERFRGEATIVAGAARANEETTRI